MNEIQPTTLQIKLSDGHQDKWCLVHDGKQVIALASPGTKTGTPADHTMLVGTKEELEAEVSRLKLTPQVTKPPRVAPVRPKTNTVEVPKEEIV